MPWKPVIVRNNIIIHQVTRHAQMRDKSTECAHSVVELFLCLMTAKLLLFVATLETQPGSRSNGDEEQVRTHPAGDKESLMDQEKLHSLKLLLLDELLLHLPKLKEVGGVQAIPFMQVSQTFFILMVYFTV